MVDKFQNPDTKTLTMSFLRISSPWPKKILSFNAEGSKLLVPAALEAAAGQEICNTAGRLLILRLECAIGFKKLKGLPRSGFL